MDERLYLDPTLAELSVPAQAAYPNSDLSLALVAASKPGELSSALSQISVRNRITGRILDLVSSAYKTERERTGEISALDLSTIEEELAIAEDERTITVSQVELAHQIYALKVQLGRPMRAAAVVLSAIAIGGGAVVSSNAVRNGKHNQSGQSVISDSSNKKMETLLGVLGGVAGGAYGFIAGIGLNDREARRRARRIAVKDTALTDPR